MIEFKALSDIYNLIFIEIGIIAIYLSYSLAMKQLYGQLYAELGVATYAIAVVTSATAYIAIFASMTSMFFFTNLKHIADGVNSIAFGCIYITIFLFALLLVRSWRLPREKIISDRVAASYAEYPVVKTPTEQ